MVPTLDQADTALTAPAHMAHMVVLAGMGDTDTQGITAGSTAVFAAITTDRVGAGNFPVMWAVLNCQPHQDMDIDPAMLRDRHSSI
jgi:hypothetical protein